MIALTNHDTWDDPKYLKPADCDELGYCVHCRTATVHSPGCGIYASTQSCPHHWTDTGGGVAVCDICGDEVPW